MFKFTAYNEETEELCWSLKPTEYISSNYIHFQFAPDFCDGKFKERIAKSFCFSWQRTQ